MARKNLLCILLATAVANLSCAGQGRQRTSDSVAPEAASGWQKKELVSAKKFMVSAAHPLAVQAGYDVLRRGGHAMDALVAVQAVLGLVEPQSSGLGGGSFAVYYDAKTGALTTFDGRETTPAAAKPDLFLDPEGRPLEFYDAVVGGRSVGTPGAVKLMGDLHKRYGRKPWAELLGPAIKLAEKGFPVSPRLAGAIKLDRQRLARYPDTRRYFLDGDRPWGPGHRLKNPAYAATLRRLAEHGADDFYAGPLAASIVEKLRQVSDKPGLLSLEDFQGYQVKERPALCLPYGDHQVCGMGPPSSGALTVNQILGITRHFDLAGLGPQSAIAWQIIGDASRLAFADRARYMADSDFVPMPQGLLDPQYLKQRAALITPGTALPKAEAGSPPWTQAQSYADDASLELPSTSHISIIDADGNVVSVTTSIENAFGSRVMANGFLLNNELTDFSFVPEKDGSPVANRLEAGKRPRSSMSPMMVLKNGKPILALGSPGGARIIGYVAKALIAHLEWGLDIQQAIDLPNMLHNGGAFELEKGTAAQRFEAELKAMGFRVSIRDLNSGLQGIVIKPQSLSGGADPRREGVVLGD